MEFTTSRERRAAKAEAAFRRQFLAYLKDAFPDASLTDDDRDVVFRRVLNETRRAAHRSPAANADQAARFEHVMSYMREHFQTATLEDLAREAGISPFHFHRRFTEWAGRTPKSILTDLQIEHAKNLLLEGRLAMAEVATACGFSHQAHLGSRFRLMVGTSPGRWLRARRIDALAAAAEERAADERAAA